MKKINILKILSYAAFTFCASRACAQVVSETLTKTVEFPFVRQRVQLQAHASILLPALVGEQRFKNNLAVDCQRFEEGYDQYTTNIDELSRHLASEVRKAPLGYTMRPGYELFLNVELVNSAVPIESTQWSLAPDVASLQFEDGSMMSISRKVGLLQKNVEVDAEERNVLVLRSRDLACDLLSGRAHLKSTINLDVQADERVANQARRVVLSWLDQFHVLEKMDLNDRQKAAWLGFQFESYKERFAAESLAEYMNVHYFFETFFQPNQMVLQSMWQSDLSQNWHKTIQVTLPIGVEHL